MRRFWQLTIIGLAVTSGLLSAALAAGPGFQTYYWVAGRINNGSHNGVDITPNGTTVYLYRGLDDYLAGRYVTAEVNNNVFVINGFDYGYLDFKVGQEYNFTTQMIKVGENFDEEFFGAAGAVKISGNGWDEIPNLNLAASYLAPGVIRETGPEIKVWFGSRLYQPKLVEKGQTFVINPSPSIRLDFSIPDPYTLAQEIENYYIVLDPGTSYAKVLGLKAQNFSQKTYAGGTEPGQGQLKNMSLQYDLSDQLSAGPHVFKFAARSSGTLGIAGIGTVYATVEVMGGPSRIVGPPITFPSPFSITRHGAVNIQYQLSADTNVQIILVDISGQRVKNWLLNAGEEGGNAGINKVAWDGKTDRGTLAGNGIYLGTIIARDESRRLGSVKLTIVD